MQPSLGRTLPPFFSRSVPFKLRQYRGTARAPLRNAHARKEKHTPLPKGKNQPSLHSMMQTPPTPEITEQEAGILHQLAQGGVQRGFHHNPKIVGKVPIVNEHMARGRMCSPPRWRRRQHETESTHTVETLNGRTSAGGVDTETLMPDDVCVRSRLVADTLRAKRQRGGDGRAGL